MVHTQLYDLVLVVELQDDGGKNVPFISYRFPSLFEQDPFSASVTQFCFPDINKFPAVAMPKEIFSFVLTEGDGERRFGYCLRKLPAGTGPRFPIAFSIMAYFPCYPLYSKILERMAYHYENNSMAKLTEFLDSVWQQPSPAPGDSFQITLNQESSSLRFTRPNDSDSLLEHIDLESLLTMLDERNILIIFAALLVERRIIFCGSQLSTLSNCIQTAVALVYPFTWQHIYIPVLPRSLLSFVCAPMPFVVGILDTDLQEVMGNPMDEVLLINIDTNEFIMAPTGIPEDELNDIPEEYLDSMRKSLKNASKQIKRMRKREREKRSGDIEMMRSQHQYELRLLKGDLTTAFIEFFVRILGEYRAFIRDGQFDKDGFIASQAPEIQQFVENMTTAQMFDCFINDAVSDQDQSGFDDKIDAYEYLREQMSRMKSEGGSIRHKPNLFNSLRKNPFSRKEAAPQQNMVLGAPTLVKASNDRSDAVQQVAPPVPPKPSGPPEFIVPQKPLPAAPKSPRFVPERPARPSTHATLPASFRNTWKPQSPQGIGLGNSQTLPPKDPPRQRASMILNRQNSTPEAMTRGAPLQSNSRPLPQRPMKRRAPEQRFTVQVSGSSHLIPPPQYPQRARGPVRGGPVRARGARGAVPPRRGGPPRVVPPSPPSRAAQNERTREDVLNTPVSM